MKNMQNPSKNSQKDRFKLSINSVQGTRKIRIVNVRAVISPIVLSVLISQLYQKYRLLTFQQL